ncbi:Nucleo P87 domain containing protein [Pyrenophora tritici-repentis]|nr:Nucleo P87 domain containing protein [Pyrenophora tritici-repentis]
MAEAKEEWKIPKLTAENHDAWFRRNKVKLKGRESSTDLSDAVKELDITDNKTAKKRRRSETSKTPTSKHYQHSGKPITPAEPTPAEPTPAQPTEQAATEQVEPPTAEEMEPPPAEQMDTSPAEQVELNPEPIERRRGRPRKLTTAPPTTVSRDERVPDLATEESEEPVQSLPEAPRYFTRGSKRKRAGEDTAEDERFRKIIKAMLAQTKTPIF